MTGAEETIIDRIEEVSGGVKRLADQQREQTAATILAALIAKGRSVDAQGPDDIWGCRTTAHEAVLLADLLRAELAK